MPSVPTLRTLGSTLAHAKKLTLTVTNTHAGSHSKQVEEKPGCARRPTRLRSWQERVCSAALGGEAVVRGLSWLRTGRPRHVGTEGPGGRASTAWPGGGAGTGRPRGDAGTARPRRHLSAARSRLPGAGRSRCQLGAERPRGRPGTGRPRGLRTGTRRPGRHLGTRWARGRGSRSLAAGPSKLNPRFRGPRSSASAYGGLL